jgi:beta-N-acetylhexosaminidase
LFARNWQDRQQLTALTAEVKAIRDDLLICVDHEGGRVQRFRTDGFTALPPMRVLGEAWMKDALAATDAASAAGFVLGAELRACGVDLSFTPVLDLDFGGSSVIGDRAFHRDPRVVTMLAKSLMHGLLRAGMGNCGKHYPGHGFVKADSHHEIPVDKRSLRAILADDARPYDWLSTTLTSVMPAHVVYAKVDDRPAGFSERWLKEILRGQFGFTGAVFSDDLSMAGARLLRGRELSYAEAAAIALTAGCDLVLLCNQSIDGGSAVDALLDGLAEAAARGLWLADPDSEARRLALLPTSAPLTWDELMHDAVYQHALERLP